MGEQIGSKGVVVHVGKYTTIDPMEALNLMENVRKAISKGGAMLLIETPAGCGTELCVNIEEFQRFEPGQHILSPILVRTIS